MWIVCALVASLPLQGTVGRAFIYVDPCTADIHDERWKITGEACASMDVRMVSVWSSGFSRMLLNKEETSSEEAGEVSAALAPSPGEERTWAEANLDGYEVVGVISGSDAGLATAERLLHSLAPSERSNGILNARRDKFEMHETIRAAGLEAAQQAVACDWQEALRFLGALPTPLRVVVKPRRGMASMKVGLATSVEEARRCLDAVLEEPASLDDEADSSSVLLQEFLDGEEWVVDTVSRGGEHKVVALWRYDKGRANGAPFVYFGIELMAAAGEKARRLCEYTTQVLDALGWRWGPAHVELMWMGDERGPVLVEANIGRCNGEEFKMLTEIAYGYSAYDACFAALLAPAAADDSTAGSTDDGADDDADDEGDETFANAWDFLPSRPPERMSAAARFVKLVSSVAGRLVQVAHSEALEALPSLVRLHLEASEPGDMVLLTRDLNSCAGDAVLIHGDSQVVEADYAVLRALQSTLFEVETDESTADAMVSMPPAERLRLESEEVMRLAALIRARSAAEEDALDPAPWRTLLARFPLVEGDFEIQASSASAAATSPELAAQPRRLGEALLRAIRSARDEAHAIAHCELLLLRSDR
jgi:glutathione synthase/RimK-type ligase-like ATP-grasp enzyme